MNRLKYGIAGFGGIAENRIVREGFGLSEGRFNPSAELIGVSNRSSAKAETVKKLGLKWYKDLDEMIADKDIEACFIATNNGSHAEIAEKLIKNGKHCLIEKPIATSIEDAERLIRLAAENNVSIMANHMMTGNTFNREARNMISSGIIGEVGDIDLHMEFSYGSTSEEAASWRCSDPSELGGPIGDVGSHCLYMAEFLLNDKISELACTYTPPTYPIKVENGAIIRFRMNGGSEGEIRVAFNNNRGGFLGTVSNLGFEVYGEEGILRSFGTLFQLSGHEDEPYTMRLELETSDGCRSVVPEKIENIYQKQIEKHAESIRSGNYYDGSDALHNLKMIAACHESAEGDSSFIKI